MKKILFCLILLLASPAWAVGVAGVNIPDQIVLEDQTLILNGAGVRTKFFFDIYVGALYVAQPIHQADSLLQHPSPSRVSMDILYSDVDKEKLIKGWLAGFKKSQSHDAFSALKGRLHRFNQMFIDLHKGERVYFDFLSNGQTSVVIKGKHVGGIAGLDFQRALLAVWFGDKPADKGLKQAMLKGK